MQFNIFLLFLINTALGQNDPSPDLKDIVFEQKEQRALIKMMTESINYLMDDNHAMANSLTQVISENKVLRERLDHLTLIQTEQRLDNFISFTAFATVTRSYQAGTTVLFDQAVVNYGESFNPSSSIFTCPVTAYYLFHTSLVSGRDDVFSSGMYLNEDFIIGAYSTARGTATLMILRLC